ncbi:cell division protein ZapC [Photobacterium sp. DA100]|uniref:cell division protein ZapC n=1 Tax=Photobacterium sp. DA100 TaxID=3027472 RepID=UPI002478C625|nr:cell division protein ZapC [Photobacterium sp. DA100]WEM43867.1 cell division protein ZapC [Photobacterium sp. DA100]
MLKPNNSWMWYYDQKYDALMLDLGDDMLFRVAIPTKNLIPCAFTRSTFTVDDASVYQSFLEGMSILELSAPRKAELALNAVAASRFHKPLMPKSWFFNQQSGAHQPQLGDIVTLSTDLGEGQFLIIENSGTASLCMMANTSSLALNAAKEMAFCETIKVMNDRMKAYEGAVEAPVRFALVG